MKKWIIPLVIISCGALYAQTPPHGWPTSFVVDEASNGVDIFSNVTMTYVADLATADPGLFSFTSGPGYIGGALFAQEIEGSSPPRVLVAMSDGGDWTHEYYASAVWSGTSQSWSLFEDHGTGDFAWSGNPDWTSDVNGTGDFASLAFGATEGGSIPEGGAMSVIGASFLPDMWTALTDQKDWIIGVITVAAAIGIMSMLMPIMRNKVLRAFARAGDSGAKKQWARKSRRGFRAHEAAWNRHGSRRYAH